MKVLKRAEQRNFRVNTEAYTEYELKEMEDCNFIEMLFGFYVVYASDCKEVKVIYNKNLGCYENVVVLNNDKEIVISL